MTEQTYSQTARDKRTVTLLVHPGTPQQRAVWTCQADRLDHRLNAVVKARAKYGDDVELTWKSVES